MYLEVSSRRNHDTILSELIIELTLYGRFATMAFLVGLFVGDLVGVLIGLFVGDLVGVLVGLFVGDLVGFFVGDWVGYRTPQSLQSVPIGHKN